MVNTKIKKDDTIMELIAKGYMSIKRRGIRMITEKKLDLTLEQIFVLMILQEENGANLSTLSEYADREKTTITRMVDGLERHNLVVRVSDTRDRRQKMIYLTNPGREKVKEIRQLMPEMQKIVLQDLKAEDIKIMTKLLVKIIENLNQ